MDVAEAQSSVKKATTFSESKISDISMMLGSGTEDVTDV